MKYTTTISLCDLWRFLSPVQFDNTISIGGSGSGRDIILNGTSIGGMLSTDYVQSSVLNELSAVWDSTYTTVFNTSADWESVYLTVYNLSGGWGGADSRSWDSAYTTVNAFSGAWNSVYTNANEASAGWNSTQTMVNNTSASWDSAYTTVNTTSADWTSLQTVVQTNSATWNSTSDISYLSGQIDNIIIPVTVLQSTSSSWDAAYSVVTGLDLPYLFDLTISSPSGIVDSIAVNSGDSLFYEFKVVSGYNMYAGNIIAITDGVSVAHTFITTSDLGDVSWVNLNISISAGSVTVGATVTGSWNIKGQRKII